MSLRSGIDSYQGTGPNNCDIYKLIATYDSSTETPAQAQIPASQMAHVHGYEVTYNAATEQFSATEVSDIEMSTWDAFFPVWTYNDPVSHLHPVITTWTAVQDTVTQIGSSAGWHYNAETGLW